jgi:hypothetical protein
MTQVSQSTIEQDGQESVLSARKQLCIRISILLDSGFRRNDNMERMPVIPAKAGIQKETVGWADVVLGGKNNERVLCSR